VTTLIIVWIMLGLSILGAAWSIGTTFRHRRLLREMEAWIADHQAAQAFIDRLASGQVIVESDRGDVGYLELIPGADDSLQLRIRTLGHRRAARH
jgi:hypothetical protein